MGVADDAQVAIHRTDEAATQVVAHFSHTCMRTSTPRVRPPTDERHATHVAANFIYTGPRSQQKQFCKRERREARPSQRSGLALPPQK